MNSQAFLQPALEQTSLLPLIDGRLLLMLELLPYVAYAMALAGVVVFVANIWMGRRKTPLQPEDFERNPGDW